MRPGIARRGLTFKLRLTSGSLWRLQRSTMVGITLSIGLVAAPGTLAAAAETEVVATAERGLPLVRFFGPREYGAAPEILAAAACPDGTMLFATSDALLEYDGLTWRHVVLPESTRLCALAADAEGTAWAGGRNEVGRLGLDPAGRRRYVSLRAFVPPECGDIGQIKSVHATPAGIWFQSDNTILRWRDNAFTFWRLTGEGPISACWMDDFQLIVSRDSGWFRPLGDGAWEIVGRAEDNLGGLRLIFALPLARRGWLVGVERRGAGATELRVFDGIRVRPEPHPLASFFSTRRLSAASRLSDGGYLLGTERGGTVALDRNLIPQTMANARSGLSSDAVLSMAVDAHGAIWLGTDWGVARVLQDRAISVFDAAAGLPLGGAQSLIRWENRLWLGGRSGLHALQPSEDPVGAAQFAPLPDLAEKISTLAVSRAGLLIGGESGAWIKGGTGQPTVRLPVGSNVTLLRESQVCPGELLAVTDTGCGVLRSENGEWKWLPLLTQPPGDISSMVETADGTLWVGGAGQGVWQITAARTSDGHRSLPVNSVRFGASAGLPIGFGRTQVFEDGNGPVFATAKGLFRYDATERRFQRERAYGERIAGGALLVRAFAADRQGGAWIMAQMADAPDGAGAMQLGYARGERWEVAPLENAGRLGNYARLYLEDSKDGVVWVGGEQVIYRLDLPARQSHAEAAAGTSVIRSVVTVDGHALLRAASTPQMRAGGNSLRIGFATPALGGEPQVTHETILHGFAQGGPLSTPGSERTFTNLPAGSYRFEVRGRSADGRLSAPAELAFAVLPAWWSTPWAVFAAAGATVFLLTGMVRWRTLHLARERERLERVVAGHTGELERTNRELRRLHRLEKDEKLAARLAGEKAELEMLRYQLNPHFLYNSLNSIRALIYTNADAAGQMVTRLSEFCRSTLSGKPTEHTTLGEELEMLRAYLDIEQTRWQENLVIRFEISPALLAERLPNFLLLPLMENAIKYGGRTCPGLLQITLAIRREADLLVCEVANTGHWVDAPHDTHSPISTGIGLENLRSRLNRHYGPAAQLCVAEAEGWVRVQLRLPRSMLRRTAAPNPEPLPI